EGTFVAGKNAEVTVHAVGARLAVQLSPEAAVLLGAGREQKSLSSDPKLAQRIGEIFPRMPAGDPAAPGGLGSTEYAGWNQTLLGVWRDWCAERGGFERHEVLGTNRTGDLLEAFVRLDFETSSFVLTMHFRDERWSGYEVDAGVPPGPAFVA